VKPVSMYLLWNTACTRCKRLWSGMSELGWGGRGGQGKGCFVCACGWVGGRGGCYQGNNSSYEAEVNKMLRIDTRERVDLQHVVGGCGVLEETVHWVEHLVGDEVKPFPSVRAGVECELRWRWRNGPNHRNLPPRQSQIALWMGHHGTTPAFWQGSSHT